ncbi:MAG: alpha/beta hydrolase [Thermodesulfobacteriota bacterium]|nr:alpha/beta hydrolase [Thermodesulfobacteriota bacterium]
MKIWFKTLIILMCLVILPTDQIVNANAGPDCVVLLHGLARTKKSLLKLEQSLGSRGFQVVNIGYPSRKKNIETLAEETIKEACNQCRNAATTKIHFVTHSMGGLLVRYFLAHNKIPELGRVVMLSPPNQGSEIVDKLKGTQIFKWINGPAGQQLGTGKTSLPVSLGPPDYVVGIIIGDRSINPILSLLIPGADDGKVSVENAKLEGMKDFLVVHKTHPFIMDDYEVIKQIIFFIKKGMFEKNENRKNG